MLTGLAGQNLFTLESVGFSGGPPNNWEAYHKGVPIIGGSLESPLIEW